MKCEDIRKEWSAFLSHDLDDGKKAEIQAHMKQCPDCAREWERHKKLSEVLHTWKSIEPSPRMYETLAARMEGKTPFWGKVFSPVFIKKAAFRCAEVVVIAGLTLGISHVLRKPAPAPEKIIDTINLYFTEHQGAALRTVSGKPTPQTKARISLHPEDFLYYEHIDGFPRYIRPGVILRGTSRSQRELPIPEPSSIHKGEVLDLPQARKAVDFDPVAPVRMFPGYILDSIRKVEDFNSLHLIYTNGVKTLSLFEQPLTGEQRLAAQDFREYAVYRSHDPAAGKAVAPNKATILAWRNGSVSFVLIGNEDMSRLMDIAQAVSAVNKQMHGTHE
jgi:hypothetical protein